MKREKLLEEKRKIENKPDLLTSDEDIRTLIKIEKLLNNSDWRGDLKDL